MRLRYRFLLFIACLSGVSISYAADNPPADTTQNVAASASAQKTAADNFSDPAKSIVVQSDSPQFTLRLQSNPTTGYSWFLNGFDPNLIQVVSHQFYPPQDQRPGAGGYEEWIFKAAPAAFMAPRITHITLVYARPWEADRAHKTRFTVVTK